MVATPGRLTLGIQKLHLEAFNSEVLSVFSVSPHCLARAPMGPEAISQGLTPRTEPKDLIDICSQKGRDLVDGSPLARIPSLQFLTHWFGGTSFSGSDCNDLNKIINATNV